MEFYTFAYQEAIFLLFVALAETVVLKVDLTYIES